MTTLRGKTQLRENPARCIPAAFPSSRYGPVYGLVNGARRLPMSKAHSGFMTRRRDAGLQHRFHQPLRGQHRL